MFYNGKNILLTINNSLIFANEAQLSYEADVTPRIELGQRYAFEVAPSNLLRGSLNVSYFFTGSDPIKKLIPLDDSISFDFGGIKNHKAYLRAFSAKFAPHSPVVCNAEIIFFTAPSGTFTPQQNALELGNIVHVNEISLTDFNNKEISGNYLSANYTYSTNITPEIYISNIDEERGVFDLKESTLNIICDNYSPFIEISGTKVGAVLGVGPFGNTLITEGYSITGFLTKKTFQARPDEQLTNEITIKQFSVLEEAIIYGFTPQSGRYRDKILITGKNFNYVAQVFFGEFEADSFTILDDQNISAVVPRAKTINEQQIRMLTLA